MRPSEIYQRLTNQCLKLMMRNTPTPRFAKGGFVNQPPPKEIIKAWIDVKCLNRSFYYKGLDCVIHVFHNHEN